MVPHLVIVRYHLHTEEIREVSLSRGKDEVRNRDSETVLLNVNVQSLILSPDTNYRHASPVTRHKLQTR